MASGRSHTRQMTFGRALRGGADIFARRWPALLGTYFIGLLLQVAVFMAGMAGIAYVVTASVGMGGVILVVLLTGIAFLVVVGTEYLIVCRLALDAYDETNRPFGEVVSRCMSRLGAFMLRIVVLALFLTMLRLAAGLLLFPLMGASPEAGIVVAIVFIVLTLVIFVLTLAFLPYVVLEKLKEPLRSSVAISFERAFTVMPVLLCMGGALGLAALVGAASERSGMAPVGQILAVGLQGIVYVFGYCVLAVIFRSSSLGEAAMEPVFAIPPVPGALERFSITPGTPPGHPTPGSGYPQGPAAGVAGHGPVSSAGPPGSTSVPPGTGPPPGPVWQEVQVTHPEWGAATGSRGGVTDPWGWAQGEARAAPHAMPDDEVAATDESPPPA